MSVVITASSRGQIVIPKEIRRDLKIVPGKKLSVKEESGRILITPLPDDPVEAFCGVFDDGPSLTQALLEERKEDKARETKESP
jgi:AbrB family looped-hinge helix DNA binding protein